MKVKQFIFKDCELFFSVVGNLAKGNQSKFSNTKPGQGKQKNLNFALPRPKKLKFSNTEAGRGKTKQKLEFRTYTL